MKLFFCLSLVLLLIDAGPLPKKKKKSLFVDDGEDGENGVEVLIEKAGKPSKDDLPENQEANEDEDIIPPPLPSDEKAQMILQEFGFIKPGALSDSEDEDVEDMIVAAIKDYQKIMGIQVTGVLDDPTKEKLSSPRCGQRDDVADENSGSKKKWSKTNLSYIIRSVTGQIDNYRIRDVFRQAFSAWAAVTPLKFREVRPYEHADIRISFERGDHGDGVEFDGRGGAMSHAFYPEKGILHFDNDERWVDGDVQILDKLAGVDLYEAAIHEIGHALGLAHIFNKDAVMFPSAHPNIEGEQYHPPRLSADDIAAIQSLYGSKKEGDDENGGGKKGGTNGGPNVEESHEERERGGRRRAGRRRGGRRRKGGSRSKKIVWRHGPYHSYYAFGCDLPGRDTEDLEVDDADECANECFDRDDCFAWVSDEDGQCFLKGKFDIMEAKRVNNRKNICGAWFS